MVKIIKVETGSFEAMQEELKYYKPALWSVQSVRERPNGDYEAILIKK